MTQEEKELLLKDLCSRLPYWIEFYFEKTNEILPLVDISQSHMFPLNDIEILLNRKYPLQWCRPYLRPLSSMTEEERNEYFDFRNQELQRVAFAEIGRESAIAEVSDWLNKHHFDYRGLIEKELALEAPKDMYKI